jgi:hypothetical protein
MDEQTRATAMIATQDAWDRLAALAFGDTASAGGCSVHAHDCTCLAQEHVSVEEAQPADGAAPSDSLGFEITQVAADIAGNEETSSAPGTVDHLVPTAPDSERPVDSEVEQSATQGAPVLPAAERPVHPDPEPDPSPPWTPEREPETAD